MQCKAKGSNAKQCRDKMWSSHTEQCTFALLPPNPRNCNMWHRFPRQINVCVFSEQQTKQFRIGVGPSSFFSCLGSSCPSGHCQQWHWWSGPMRGHMMKNNLLLWIALCAIKAHMHDDACTPFMLLSSLHLFVLVITVNGQVISAPWHIISSSSSCCFITYDMNSQTICTEPHFYNDSWASGPNAALGCHNLWGTLEQLWW